MNRRKFISAGSAALAFPTFTCAAQPGVKTAEEPFRLDVHFDQPRGTLRALHGVNKGPLTGGGLIDLTEAQCALHIPWTRLHDCHFPNPDVVDMHAVFPRAEADPALESNYDFARTDVYLEEVRATGAGIVYRLGESIEHEPIKKWVHPPQDAARWAQQCLGIIRHYNEGWASGFHFGIPYWEIWNEPENRPAMWTGSDEDYFALYRTASLAIKKAFPALKIGGPAIGGPGNFANRKFQPSPFLTSFLMMCRRDSVPLDFFSWHCYTDNPMELSARARAIRTLLDEHGFTKTESHLNEWNYLPDNSWNPLLRRTPPVERQRAYEKMSGPHGAAFIAAALIELQDAPVDVANLFHGEVGAFGLFTEQAVPLGNYYAMLAFAEMIQTPLRVPTTEAKRDGIFSAAGLSKDGAQASVLIANRGATKAIRLVARGLPWNNSSFQVQQLRPGHGLVLLKRDSFSGETGELSLDTSAPSLLLVTLSGLPK